MLTAIEITSAREPLSPETLNTVVMSRAGEGLPAGGRGLLTTGAPLYSHINGPGVKWGPRPICFHSPVSIPAGFSALQSASGWAKNSSGLARLTETVCACLPAALRKTRREQNNIREQADADPHSGEYKRTGRHELR